MTFDQEDFDDLLLEFLLRENECVPSQENFQSEFSDLFQKNHILLKEKCGDVPSIPESELQHARNLSADIMPGARWEEQDQF